LAAWESVTPNIHINGNHLASFGAVSPLAGSQWHTTTTGTAQRFTPTWAIIMCVLFIWVCLLGLLFLIVKQERYVGEVTVTVRTAGGQSWSDSVPVQSIASRDYVLQRVAWAQTRTSHADFSGR